MNDVTIMQPGIISKRNQVITDFLTSNHVAHTSKIVETSAIHDLSRLNSIANRASDLMSHTTHNGNKPVIVVINDSDSGETLLMASKEREKRNYTIMPLAKGMKRKAVSNVSPKSISDMLKNKAKEYTVYSLLSNGKDNKLTEEQFTASDFERSWGYPDENTVRLSAPSVERVITRSGLGAINKVEHRIRRLCERAIIKSRDAENNEEVASFRERINELLAKLTILSDNVKLENNFYSLREMRDIVRLDNF